MVLSALVQQISAELAIQCNYESLPGGACSNSHFNYDYVGSAEQCAIVARNDPSCYDNGRMFWIDHAYNSYYRCYCATDACNTRDESHDYELYEADCYEVERYAVLIGRHKNCYYDNRDSGGDVLDESDRLDTLDDCRRLCTSLPECGMFAYQVHNTGTNTYCALYTNNDCASLESNTLYDTYVMSSDCILGPEVTASQCTEACESLTQSIQRPATGRGNCNPATHVCQSGEGQCGVQTLLGGLFDQSWSYENEYVDRWSQVFFTEDEAQNLYAEGKVSVQTIDCDLEFYVQRDNTESQTSFSFMTLTDGRIFNVNMRGKRTNHQHWTMGQDQDGNCHILKCFDYEQSNPRGNSGYCPGVFYNGITPQELPVLLLQVNFDPRASQRNRYTFKGTKYAIKESEVCAPGSGLVGGSCEPCLEGTFSSDPNTDLCHPCPAGTHSQDTGNTECSPCEIGYFSDTPQSAQCSQCPDGSTTLEVGAQSCIGESYLGGVTGESWSFENNYEDSFKMEFFTNAAAEALYSQGKLSIDTIDCDLDFYVQRDNTGSRTSFSFMTLDDGVIHNVHMRGRRTNHQHWRMDSDNCINLKCSDYEQSNPRGRSGYCPSSFYDGTTPLSREVLLLRVDFRPFPMDKNGSQDPWRNKYTFMGSRYAVRAAERRRLEGNQGRLLSSKLSA